MLRDDQDLYQAVVRYVELDTVVFEPDYPIGDAMQLVSVRVRGLKCTCAAP